MKSIKYSQSILIVVLCIIIMPFLLVCFYGVPSADDFSNSLGWINNENNKLVYLFENDARIFMNWQGTYFGCLLVGLPIYYLFGITGVKLVYFFSTLFFVLSTFFSCYVSKYFISKDNKFSRSLFVLILSTVCLYYIMATCPMNEIFYWWTGICVYTIPCSCMLLSISFLILSEQKNKFIYLFSSCVFAICAAGGALNIAALLCSVLFFIIVYNYFFYDNYKNKQLYIVFFVSLLGSLANALAPGNFVRHAIIDSDTKYISSLLIACKRVVGLFFRELHLYDNQLMLVIFIGILLGYFFCRNFSSISLRKFLFIVIYSFLAIIIVDYPIILGYSSADYFPSRVIFVEHLAITFYFLISSIYLGAYLYQRDFVSIKTSVVVILSFVFLSQMQDFGVRSFTSLKILKHLYKSDYKDFYSSEMEMLEKIQSSLDNDVVLTIYRDQSKQQWTNLKPIELSTDKNDWVNNTVAKFFGKNSVVVKYDEGNKE